MKIEPLDTVNRVFPVEPARVQQPKEHVEEQVKPVAKSAQPELHTDGNELRFGMDEETREPVIRVVDRDTEDIIDQIPRGSWRPWPPTKK
jgi:uncharacterized FlaG/YvyC family protein